jgi:hypothetical protein
LLEKGKPVLARFAPFVALTLLLGPTASASAQNLPVNPNFDTSLDGWQTSSVPGTIVSWDGTRDADGSPTSGSATGLWQAPTVTGLIPVVSQCIEVTPGVAYTHGGKIFIPSGQPTSGSAFFLATVFPTHGCSGPPPPGPFIPTPAVTALDTWTESTATIVPFGPSLVLSAYMAPNSGGSFQASFDNLILDSSPPGSCIPDSHTLCFQSGRFKATATYDAGNGNAGQAHAVPAGDSGLFWFFSPSNIEIVLKVLDGCPLGGHFWVFAGGLTNVQVTITVTDTQTAITRAYHNPTGIAFTPIQDTSAFTCAP